MSPNRGFLRFFALALALSQALVGAPAFARDSSENEDVRAERALGTVAVNLGRYDEAVEHFSRAYTVGQDPGLLFNLAQAYRLAGKPEKALATYSAFLRAAGSSRKFRQQIERTADEIESVTSFMLNNRPANKLETPERAIEPPRKPEAVAESEVAPPPVPTVKEIAPAAPPPPEPREPKVAKLEPAALVPKPEPAASPALTFTPETPAPQDSPPVSRPVYGRWWFWTGVASALALGGAATWWYTQPNNQTPAATYGALKVLP